MDNYLEIGEQIFNLVDNDKDKVNSFYDAMSQEDEETSLTTWFKDNVKDNELKDLFKQGQDDKGLMKWITSENGHSYFLETPAFIDTDTKPLPSTKEMTSDTSKIHRDIEEEDSSILSDEQIAIKKDMSDGEYTSDEVDNDDEIQIALDALDSSDDDVDIIFNIVDGSDGAFDEDEDDSSDDDGSEESDEDETEKEEIIHKKRIYLDHHVNKVVESIDDEEEVDRHVHKKYYVMKKAELISTENMDRLEDELDKENISYYDFGKDNTIAIKIYTQNEVRLNRIFEHLGFEARCVDIAHYTDDWYSKS